jgi:Permuted papain-like amidase enzyme, YaeF/YiiX, C92 family
MDKETRERAKGECEMPVDQPSMQHSGSRGTDAPDAMADFNAILKLATTRAQTAAQLVGQLRQIYAIAAHADLGRYDFDAIRRSAPDLLRGTGHLRLALRDQIPDWEVRGLMTRDVQSALRDVFRIMRYAADMLGELAIDYQRLDDGEKAYPGFMGPGLSTIFHAAAGPSPKLEFRSGDVLLVRGLHHNSAAIARIGDIDSQFSHICMVHVDKAGTPWVVEALIEDGAVINSLDHALAHGIGRAALFRHKDTALAQRAAEMIHDHIKRSQNRWFGRILYDFTMQLTGRKRLFCSKLVRQAFEMASKGQVLLPTYKTSFQTANREFLGRIGVTARETFAPADIELESHFDMIAEWADHRVTSDLRLQDMVLSKMFEWMEKDGWRFQEDFLIRVVGWFGRFSAHWFEGVKTLLADLIPKVPINMPRKTIATVAMLHKTAGALFDQLQPIELETIQRTGHPMHGRDVLEALDRIRAASGGRIGYLVAPKGARGK